MNSSSIYSNQVKFHPWIGENYDKDNQFGIKILVLGESHYVDQSENSKEFTKAVVLEIGKNKRHRFFTTIAKLLTNLGAGKYISNEDRSKVCDDYAFYNFVQFPLTDARVRPTAEMWEKSLEPFIEVVQLLQPDLIVILGYALANQIPEETLKSLNVAYCGVRHPSGGLQYDIENPKIQQAILNAKTKKS